MNWSKRIRTTHRWLSITFTITVIMATVAVSVSAEPAAWVLYLPLFPLAFLMFSGLYMFVLPYRTRRRSG